MTLPVYRAVITSDNVVTIFNDTYPNEDGSPFIHQPFDPATGDDWSNKASAQAWADDFIAERTSEPEDN